MLRSIGISTTPDSVAIGRRCSRAPSPSDWSARRRRRSRPRPPVSAPAPARRRTPAARSPRASPRSGAVGADPAPTAARRPASVASSGSTAWVAEEVHGRGARTRRAAPRRGGQALQRARRNQPASARARARAPRGRPRAARAVSSLVRVAAHALDERREALRRARGFQLVAEHRRHDSVSGRPRRAVQQRQVGADDRVQQPLLAERPGAEALDIGHVRVQDDRQLAALRERDAHGRQTARKSSARSRSPRRRAQHEVGGGDRRREAVVEGLGQAQPRVDGIPARLSASSWARSLRAWKRPCSSTRREVRPAERSNSSRRYSCMCHGLSELAAPGAPA